jgi:hypothetical protein
MTQASVFSLLASSRAWKLWLWMFSQDQSKLMKCAALKCGSGGRTRTA